MIAAHQTFTPDLVLLPIIYIQIGLSKIEFLKLSASYDEWFLSFDIVKSLIHEKQEITTIQKVHYLKSTLLLGNAKSVVDNLEISASNNTKVWDSLIARYDRRLGLIRNYHQFSEVLLMVFVSIKTH